MQYIVGVVTYRPAYEYSVFSALLASLGIVLSAGYSLYVYAHIDPFTISLAL